MNNKMRFCLMLAMFFMHGLSCSDNKSTIMEKWIKTGYLDEVYKRNKRCEDLVDVTRISVANEQEKNEKFKIAMEYYIAQVAKKYPTAPEGFDFKPYVHAYLLNLGNDQTGLLIQHAHPGHRVQIVVANIGGVASGKKEVNNTQIMTEVAKQAPEVQSNKSVKLMIVVPIAMFTAGIINSKLNPK